MIHKEPQPSEANFPLKVEIVVASIVCDQIDFTNFFILFIVFFGFLQSPILQWLPLNHHLIFLSFFQFQPYFLSLKENPKISIQPKIINKIIFESQ